MRKAAQSGRPFLHWQTGALSSVCVQAFTGYSYRTRARTGPYRARHLTPDPVRSPQVLE